MVYQVKCSRCEKVIDFGGKEPDKLPDNVIEFQGENYCRECMREIVDFATGNIVSRMENVEEAVEKISDQLGVEFDKDAP